MKTHILASAFLAGLLASLLVLPADPAAANDSGYSGGNGDGDYGSGGNSLDDARKLIEMGSYGSAIWQLKKILDASPRDPDAHNLLAYSYRNLKKYDQAQTHYERALKIDPDHVGAYHYQGVLFLETGRATEARRNLERIREICGRGCAEYRDLRDAIQQLAASDT